MKTAEWVAELERDGVIVLPELVPRETLAAIQAAFESRLERLRWNDVDGYQKTEPYRHMLQDLLTLEQGFLDVALHPLVTEIVRSYVGDSFQLVEAKGWRSIATRQGFHGWHGDAWYDPTRVPGVPREVKLAFYLTDVSSGEFQYLRGSHQREHPRVIPDREIAAEDLARIARIQGPAGSAFLFDTTGCHRQGEPILEDRNAFFFCYHDPAIPLQAEDTAYNRYHPLLLNAAFLGGLSEEDRRILGFGDRRNYIPGFQRGRRFAMQEKLQRGWLDLQVRIDEVWGRVQARLRRS